MSIIEEIVTAIRELDTDELIAGDWATLIVNWEPRPAATVIDAILGQLREILPGRPSRRAINQQFNATRARIDEESDNHAYWTEQMVIHNQTLDVPVRAMKGYRFFVYSPDSRIYDEMDEAEARSQMFDDWFKSQNESSYCKTQSHYKAIMNDASIKFEKFPEDNKPCGVFGTKYYEAVLGKGLFHEEAGPENLCRFRCRFTPDPECRTPMFDRYMGHAFKDDPEMLDLAMKVGGMALIGLMPAIQKAVLVFGEGRTGKSTYLRILREAFDKRQVTSVSPYDWADTFKLAQLAGKRFNSVGELPSWSTYNPLPSIFKQVLGGDPMTASHKHKPTFEFVNTASHFFNSNHLPKSDEGSTAFMRRWLILEFNNPIPEEEVDVTLEDRIIEEEMPGVIYKFLHYIEPMIEKSDVVIKVLDRQQELFKTWKELSDPVLEFMNDQEYVLYGEGKEVTLNVLWGHFKAYCEHNGHFRPPMKAREFKAKILMEYVPDKSRKVRYKEDGATRLLEGVTVNHNSGPF